MILTAQEKALTFGPDKGLVGVVTLPGEIHARRPAIIFLNAGLIHRVGPFRLHVEMSRSIAGQGFLTLRMDQSGLGDSQPRAGGLTYEERAVLDAKDAMDALSERFGVKAFILVGLCAGAMSAHRIALEDRRVVGVVMLDGYAYRPPTVTLSSLPTRLIRPAFWRKATRVVRRGIEHLFSRRASAPWAPDPVPGAAPGEEEPGQGAAAVFAQDWPPREEIAGELDGLLSRGCRMLFVYTGGWSYFIHERQFDEMFPGLARRDRAEVAFYPSADHTYLVLEHRDRMRVRVERFISAFG